MHFCPYHYQFHYFIIKQALQNAFCIFLGHLRFYQEFYLLSSFAQVLPSYPG